VSELCHIPPETLGKHRDLRGHHGAYRCCVKSLIASALVGFDVRQHARRESISKRAPSAFGRVNTSETFMASATVAAQLKSGTRHRTQRFTRPLYNRDLSSRSATFRNRGSERQIHLRINDLGLGCRGESRIIAGRGTWAQGVAGSNPAAPTTFRVPGFQRGSTCRRAVGRQSALSHLPPPTVASKVEASSVGTLQP